MFQGLYINMDKRSDRRAHMEREIERFGLTGCYRRLRAIADSDGARGCYRSHMKALDEARRMKGLVHILEDDSILSTALEPFMAERAPALLEQFDMIFLDMWVDQGRDSVAKFQAAMDSGAGHLALAGSGPRIACTSSYVVAPRFLGKLHKRLRYLESSRMPVDGAYNRLAGGGEMKAAVIVPFITGVDLATGTTSDIQSIPTLDQRMYVMLRTHFFIDKARQPAL